MNYILLGDEDLAQESLGRARQLAASGACGYFDLGNGVWIDIRGGANPVVYVHAEYTPQYQMLVPFQKEGGLPGEWSPMLIGYTHRKDGVTPGGKVELFGIEYGPTAFSPEIFYASDGMAMMTFIEAADGAEAWSAQDFAMIIAIVGLVDDLASMQSGKGTPLRIPSAFAGITCRGMAPASNHEQHFTSGCIYGVSRSEEANSVTAMAGVNEPTGAGNTTQTYHTNGEGVQFKVTCSWTTAGIYFLQAFSDSEQSTSAYTFGVDLLIEHQTNAEGTAEVTLDYSLESSPPPVAIALGNHDVLVLTRESLTTGDSTALFSRYFELKAYHIAGTSPLAFAGDVSALVTNYLTDKDKDDETLPEGRKGKINKPPLSGDLSNMASSNLIGINSLMLGLLHSARQPVPLPGGGTLVFSQVMHEDWFDRTPRVKTERFVCMLATSSGLYHQGNVFPAYYGAGTTQSTALALTADPIWYRKFAGAVCTGGSDIILFVYQVRWDYAGLDEGVPIYTKTIVGYCRLVSADAGATWSEHAVCSIQDAGNYEASILTAPKFVAKDEDGTVHLVAGVMRTQGGTVVDTQAAFSNDGGLTWEVNAVAGRGLEFAMDLGDPSSLLVPVAGLGTVIQTGNHVDGYAPSPYAHLPAFYGAASKASRDNSDDPKL